MQDAFNLCNSMMDSTIETWLCIWAFIFFFLSYSYAAVTQKRRLPPSPPSLPIIGHLHLLSNLPHRDLGNLSIRYGPLFFLRLGSVNSVVVSNARLAEEFLKTHDSVFASRPQLDASRIIFYNCKDIGFAPYGEHWKLMRKICIQELFTPRKLQGTRRIRVDEISCTLKSIMEDSLANIAVDLNSKLSSLATNVITRIALGRKFFGEDSANGAEQFRKMVREVFFLGGVFNIGDYLPYLSRFDLQGYKRRMEAVHVQLDAFLDEILEEEIEKIALCGKDGSDSDHLVRVLLQLQVGGGKLEHEAIKAVIQDVILAGTDTSSVTVEWAVAELLRSPGIMQRAQTELDEVVGFERLVEEEDIPNLPFLQAIVKETFRLHPAGPLLVPRESIDECKVAGYDIPKGTRLMVNAWQIGRDSQVWKNPDVFDPHRFINSSIDVRGRDFELIPFGAGRRICPGLSLGLTMVHIILACLIHSFNWDSVEEVDLSENFGLTMPMAKPLLAFATPRYKKMISP